MTRPAAGFVLTVTPGCAPGCGGVVSAKKSPTLAKLRTEVAAVAKIGSEERMIEDVVYACAEINCDAFINSEVLRHAQIDTPQRWTLFRLATDGKGHTSITIRK